MRKQIAKIALYVLLFIVPALTSAQVSITEIMYDVAGGDTGREWIEVRNDTSSPFDFSFCKFTESGTNHSLTIFKGDSMLPPNGFAVIADSPEKFLADWPNFSGILFDSGAFSLLNTGEVLAITSCADASVNYTSDLGAAGDGNSLQFSNSVWISAPPTLGLVNASSPAPAQENQSAGNTSSNTSTTTQTSSASNSNFPTEPQISARIEGPTRSIVGTGTVFRGFAIGLQKEPLDGTRFTWSFGDGSMKEGETVRHTFLIPSSYIVVLNVSSGKYSASVRLPITVIPLSISLSVVGEGEKGFIMLHNDASVEVDLSYWQLRSGGKTFVFPPHTIILAKADVPISNQISGLLPSAHDAELLYMNGEVATRAQIQAVSSSPSTVTPSTPAVSKPAAVVAQPAAVVKAVAREVEAESIEASSTTTPEATHSSSLKWFLLLGGIVFVGAGAYWVGGRDPKAGHGYSIIEEHDPS